jgi:glucuronate isomerase
MNRAEALAVIEPRIMELPALDTHTHLVGGKLGARGLHDVLLYHMAVSDLYAAGCPTGARLTPYPGWPSREEAHARICEALPYLPIVRNTSTSWGVRIILRDLYDWDQDITADTWRLLDAHIRERADDRAWHREIMRAARIRRITTEVTRRENGIDDDILHYSLEWAFFTRCQWGEFDTALYELEWCWGGIPEPPLPIGAGARPRTERVIGTLDDVRQAVAWYVDHIPAKEILSMATHISTDIDLRPVSDTEMAQAVARRAEAGPAERDIYASYINEQFLTALEQRHGGSILFQFSFGAEPLPFETASRLSQKSIAQLAEMVGRHPRLRFQCYLSSAHANQSLCTLCRELPNLSVAGCWWHNFFPSIMQRVMAERLDMLPLNKQMGFFSDAYCIEWMYAKVLMVKAALARVLAEKVELGQYDVETAIDVARTILFETPQSLLGMVPAET